MRVIIQESYENVSQWVANYVITKINKAAPTASKPFILGLPTGSTPIGVYRALIEHNKAGRVSFKHVVTFNMDEYVGLAENHPQSYHHFMYEYLFNHIDIDKKNIHILNGQAEDVEAECLAYEEAIKTLGGIDLFLGGTGLNGHLAFNEPGSSLASRTRKVELTRSTIEANSRFFEHDLSKVPTTALTVGIGTILDSKEVLILLNGETKGFALQNAVEGGVSIHWPITALQLHPAGIIVCDEKAASELKTKTYDFFKFTERENLAPKSQLK